MKDVSLEDYKGTVIEKGFKETLEKSRTLGAKDKQKRRSKGRSVLDAITVNKLGRLKTDYKKYADEQEFLNASTANKKLHGRVKTFKEYVSDRHYSGTL